MNKIETNNSGLVEEAKRRLIESAGKATQDFGMGRILGQVMAVLYLAPGEASLDKIAEELALSKAAVSIATRQLEGLELVRKVWVKGDKRTYYRTVDNFAAALQNGILEMLRAKLRAGANDLTFASECLEQAQGEIPDDEMDFLKKQIRRADSIRKKADMVLNNPLVRLIGK
jgi:DNA-binding transcriptional regulator GbsR (MarR family)